MFIGLYTLYGGILLTYDNIPAGFRWIYYTNPGQLFTAHHIDVACFSERSGKHLAYTMFRFPVAQQERAVCITCVDLAVLQG